MLLYFIPVFGFFFYLIFAQDFRKSRMFRVKEVYRYGRENGHIRVRLWQEDSSLVLSVADDGIGIARNEQEKIFRRFYQADASRGGEGTGLGLAMVYEIARFYHGTVTVESVVDQGSTFVVRMPAGQS